MKTKEAKRRLTKAFLILLKSSEIHIKNSIFLKRLENEVGYVHPVTIQYRKTVFSPHQTEHNENMDYFQYSIRMLNAVFKDWEEIRKN